jgi:hypothetical protein
VIADGVEGERQQIEGDDRQALLAVPEAVFNMIAICFSGLGTLCA